MAVTTVSSLTESFTSGVPVSGEDVVLSKEKSDMVDAQMAATGGLPDHNDGMRGVEGTGVVIASTERKGELKENEGGQEHGDDSEESEFDGILEVHD